MDFLVKALIKGAAKVLPKIIDSATTKSYMISDVTASEHCNKFLTLDNHPQCVYTKTSLSSEEVIQKCRAYFEKMKCSDISETVTSDKWLVLIGIKESSLWDASEYRLEVLAKKYDNGPTNVILMFRFTAVGKLVLKHFSVKRMNEFCTIIQPNSGFENVPLSK